MILRHAVPMASKCNGVFVDFPICFAFLSSILRLVNAIHATRTLLALVESHRVVSTLHGEQKNFRGTKRRRGEGNDRKDAISKMRGRHPDQRWKYRIVLEVLPESTYRLKNRSACTFVARIWLVNEIARFSGFALVRCYLDARIGRWKSHSVIAVCDRIAVRVESTFLVIRQQILSTIWQLNTMNILLLRDK